MHYSVYYPQILTFKGGGYCLNNIATSWVPNTPLRQRGLVRSIHISDRGLALIFIDVTKETLVYRISCFIHIHQFD